MIIPMLRIPSHVNVILTFFLFWQDPSQHGFKTHACTYRGSSIIVMTRSKKCSPIIKIPIIEELLLYYRWNFLLIPTIHKNNFCSRQKYPRLLGMPLPSVSHAGHKYLSYSGIGATFHTVFQFFWFSKNFSL